MNQPRINTSTVPRQSIHTYTHIPIRVIAFKPRDGYREMIDGVTQLYRLPPLVKVYRYFWGAPTRTYIFDKLVIRRLYIIPSPFCRDKCVPANSRFYSLHRVCTRARIAITKTILQAPLTQKASFRSLSLYARPTCKARAFRCALEIEIFRFIKFVPNRV